MKAIRFKPLPDTLFLVRIPIICTYTDEEIDLFGLPLTTDNMGNEFKDTYKDLTTVMINIDKMINVFIQGYPIHIVNKEDSVAIFNILEDYLAGTVNNPIAFINQVHTEEDRLPEIERFAQEMFGLNKSTIVNKIMKDNATDGFSLGGLDLMPMKTPEQVLQEQIRNTNGIRSVTLDSSPVKKIEVKQMPMQHTAYPYVPEPKIENNNQNSVKSYAYLYDTAPDVNIDISKVTRRSNYRKIYK